MKNEICPDVDIHFGKVNKIIDYKEELENEIDPDGNDEDSETPEGVKLILGFDPDEIDWDEDEESGEMKKITKQKNIFSNNADSKRVRIKKSKISIFAEQFDESKHPRDADGKFGSGSGSNKSESSNKPKTGIINKVKNIGSKLVDKFTKPLINAGYSERAAKNIAIAAAIIQLAPTFPGSPFVVLGGALGYKKIKSKFSSRIDAVMEGQK